MICNKCGINTWYLYSGLCFACSSNPVVGWATPYTENQYFQMPLNWYECPDCKGKFTSPSSIVGYSSTSIQYKCPWCGKELKGMNG